MGLWYKWDFLGVYDASGIFLIKKNKLLHFCFHVFAHTCGVSQSLGVTDPVLFSVSLGKSHPFGLHFFILGYS